MQAEISRGRHGAETAQTSVDEHFDRSSAFWDALYGGNDVYSAIHRRRQAIALRWIEQLASPPSGHVLELGCGAGFMAIALARRGWRVHATDAVPAMLTRAQRNAEAAGVEDRLTFGLADAQRLAVEDASFDVVVALGVIPWLPLPGQALAEMARVTRDGGVVVVNADNRRRLDYAMDPRRNPSLAPLRSAVKSLLRRRRVTAGAPSHLHDVAEFDAMLAAAGVEKLRGAVYGFGPFTVLGRHTLPDGPGVRLDGFLQQRADAGSRTLASRGAQYLVAGRRRPETASADPLTAAV
jgi:ubiquinone/menaquinone biosynthesis C-methylase UbiE